MVAHRAPRKSGMMNVVRAVLVVLICQLARIISRVVSFCANEFGVFLPILV
jgi:hypothetical protein